MTLLDTAPTDALVAQVSSKGYLPSDITPWNSNVLEPKNLLKFPLGDLDNFHLCRAAQAIAYMKTGQSMSTAWRLAQYEKAYFEALAEVELKAANGEYVSGVDGGYLAPEFWSTRLFGLLRSFAILDQLPVTRISMPYRIAKLPKVATDIAISYPAESVAPTTTTFGFGQVEYTARKAIAVINASNEWIRDAPEAIDTLWTQEAAKAIAQDRDNQALNGSGAQPTGLVNDPAVAKRYVGTSAGANIQTTANHATPSFNHVAQLKSLVTALCGNANVSAGQAKVTGIIAHSRFEQTVFVLGTAAGAWTDSQGRGVWSADLNGAGGLLGVPWVLTNLLPTNSTDGGGTSSSYIIAGWWEQFILFESLTLGFDATLHGQGFGADETQIRIVHRYDCGPVHPEAFAVLAGCDQ